MKYKCALCGKTFEGSDEWAWARCANGRKKYFCRYNHMREWERTRKPDKKYKKKPVICIDTGEVYPSAQIAADAMDCTVTHIRGACTGRTKTAKGMIWRYADGQ